MEKEGSRPMDSNRMALFMDLELKGCKFTWISNPRDEVTTKEKLDRV